MRGYVTSVWPELGGGAVNLHRIALQQIHDGGVAGFVGAGSGKLLAPIIVICVATSFPAVTPNVTRPVALDISLLVMRALVGMDPL